MASDIDLPWTYLAGTDQLIAQILQEPKLEALSAQPEDPLRLRVFGWLNTAITDATAELLTNRRTTVDTARGVVHARLKHPSRRRDGWLQITRHDRDDPGCLDSTRSIHLRHRVTDSLRRAIHWDLTKTMSALVNE